MNDKLNIERYQMPLLIPVARSKTGQTVTPTCSKENGPFTCLGCAKALVLRQGEKNRWHFAHHSKDDDDEECSAGGETYIHLAAKLLLVTDIARFEFFADCDRLRHVHEKGYQGCTAAQEHRYDGIHSADVGVLRDGKLEAIVEVMATHKTQGEALASRIECVGAANVWEVEAMDVLKVQKQLSSTTDTIRLRSLLKVTTCAECAQEQRVIAQEVIDQRRREFVSAAATKANSVVIIDDNALRADGVLKKKVYLNDEDWFDRRYVWKESL